MKILRRSRFAVLALLSLAACKDKKSADEPAAASAAPSASAAPAEISCDAVVAKFESMDKIDADGKKMLGAMCADESQTVRACFLAAKTKKDLDACDPHPFKKAMDAAAGPEVTAADLVEHDLSTADPAWKGWIAKGPKDAKVMADGVHGARIAANGINAFDITFGHKKTKLADTKKGIEAGAKIMGGSAKTSFVTDTKEKLEWVTEVGTSKSWHFSWNVKVSGKDVTCSSMPMGASTESLLAVLKASCESLHKK
jgi:hypothetical protein